MNLRYRLNRLYRFIRQKSFDDYHGKLVSAGGAPVCKKPLVFTPYQFLERDAREVARVVLSGKLSHEQGNEMISLEREFASFMGTPFALATNSGTSALHLAVQAIGLDSGDEVIVPAYTFVATAQAVLSNAGIPVFADIDDTFTISPNSIKKFVTNKTRAIMVVHIFGNVAHMNEILAIARKYNLIVIEDCAQAVGAHYAGKNVGSIGDIGCFSFNSKKAIPTGQGGMLITKDPLLHRKAKAARNTGIESRDSGVDVVSLGGTFYMTEMEAVLARSILRQLPMLNNTRRKNYEYLVKLMAPLRMIVRSYRVLSHVEPSYSRLGFILDFDTLGVTRKEFIDAVQAEGIPMKTFYPTPLYRYSIFQERKNSLIKRTLYQSISLPFVEDFCRNQIGMEFSPYWNFQDMRDIVMSIHKVVRVLSKTSVELL